jgi:hypothetical protein
MITAMKALKSLLLAGVVLAIGASALGAVTPRIDPTVSTSKHFVVTCASTGLVCDPPYVFELRVRAGHKVKRMTYTAAKTHCSDVRIRVIIDGNKRPLSKPLAAGASADTNLSTLKRGIHTIKIRAVGVLGGCNTGYTGSWGGVVRFTLSKP